ncbi:hypothetical protein HYU93_01795 [Candidatus Daviesbacteria bacterium]|nr:hypothetical protein [Candidatus Daviesbacteria bacterium]
MIDKLSSIKIISGSRTYCFDIKTSVEGAKYLVIKELKNNVREGQIMIFEEYFQAFRKGFRKAVRTAKKGDLESYDIKQLRSKYPKAYELWAKDEEDSLKELWAHNKTIKEISSILQREPGAIRSRLKKLDKLKLL